MAGLHWSQLYPHIEFPWAFNGVRRDTLVAEDPNEFAAQSLQWGGVNWGARTFNHNIPSPPHDATKSEPMIVPPEYVRYHAFGDLQSFNLAFFRAIVYPQTETKLSFRLVAGYAMECP